MVAGRKKTRADQRSTQVVDRARRKAIELEVNRAGIETVQENGDGKRLTVVKAVASYLKGMEPPQREPRTYQAYKHCVEVFANNCAKNYIQDVKREDLLGSFASICAQLWSAHCLQPGGNCFAALKDEWHHEAPR
jgi:hypothetical protein